MAAAEAAARAMITRRDHELLLLLLVLLGGGILLACNVVCLCVRVKVGLGTIVQRKKDWGSGGAR